MTEFDGEGAVQEYLEKMCNPLKPEGEWVSKIDLIQEGDQLQLGMQPTHGHCEKECRTIERACDDVIDKADTEFTEILYSAIKEKTPLEKVQRYICNRAAGVCKKKPPPLKKRKDYKFRCATCSPPAAVMGPPHPQSSPPSALSPQPSALGHPSTSTTLPIHRTPHTVHRPVCPPHARPSATRRPMTAEEKQMVDMQNNLKETGVPCVCHVIRNHVPFATYVTYETCVTYVTYVTYVMHAWWPLPCNVHVCDVCNARLVASPM